MKLTIYNLEKHKVGEKDLPAQFKEPFRPDLIKRAIHALQSCARQPYGSAPLAGQRASSEVSKRRRDYRGCYGFGISRVRRKILSKRGTRMFWVGATTPQTVGGRRAHPPKVEKMLNYGKLNKKEILLALKSAISATANLKFLQKRYLTLQDKSLKIELPFVVESKFVEQKTKQLINSLNKILGNELAQIAIKKKSRRSGKGKMRGRGYKVSAGVLIVVGEKEKLNSKNFDSVKVNSLSVMNLAEADAPGRLTIYTEEAVKELGEKLK